MSKRKSKPQPVPIPFDILGTTEEELLRRRPDLKDAPLPRRINELRKLGVYKIKMKLLARSLGVEGGPEP